MDRLTAIGRQFFAVALIALGVQQFLVRDIVVGRAPAWPAGWPGHVAIAYLSGLALLVIGGLLIGNRGSRTAGLLGALMVAVFALARHLPIVAGDSSFGFAWTNAGKALALTGGLLVAADSSGPGAHGLDAVGRWCLAAFLILAGIQHFLFADFVKLLVPVWIPGPLFWTYFAGVALIAGGAGMLVPPTARLAAGLTGLMIFLWVLTLHIPRAIAAAPDGRRNEWTAVFEALAFTGVALMLTRDRRR